MGAIAARVIKLQRERARRDKRRGIRVASTMEPGRLLSLVPRLSPQFFEPEHLAPVADEIERIADGETVEVCFSLPPRHAKTSTLLHAIVWLLLRDPTITVLYVSYAHGFAAKQVRRAMRLAERAGVALGDTKRRDEWNTAAGGGVKAAGLGGQITGEGFRVVIVDDPHKNRAEAESRQIRERVIEGFKADVYSRQDPRGTSFLICHTRWVEDDLIGTLTRNMEADADLDDDATRPMKLINLPAITATGVLAPRLFDSRKLAKIRARVGEYAWASLYMGSPRPKGGLLFSGAALVESLPESGSYRYAIGIDLSHTARTRSDWNVAVVMRQHTTEKHFEIVEVVRHQGTLTDRVRGRGEEPEPEIDEGFLRKLHELHQRYPTVPIHMYAAKDETLLLSLASRHDKYPVKIRATLAESDKWRRAQPYASAWNNPAGIVRLPRRAHWVDAFVREHVGFTGLKGHPDDQVDAAAAAFDALATKSGGTARGTGEGSEAARLSKRIAI